MVKAWNALQTPMVKESFKVCGQLKGVQPEDIACMKEGRALHGALPLAQSLWSLQPEEIDLDQLCPSDHDQEEVFSQVEEEEHPIINI